MQDWGYTINNDNQINFDFYAPNLINKLIAIEPSIRSCIACGSCTGVCSAGNFIQMNLRKIIALIARGEIQTLSQELAKCMLCGKCTLVCPRGVNTRNVIVNAKNILSDLEVVNN